MRVVSFCKCIDIPYENACFYIEKKNGRYNIVANFGVATSVMGNYYSIEKAKSVMEELREQYRTLKEFHGMPDRFKQESWACLPDKMINSLPVFYFPQDSEV